ncbi:LAFE_0F07734g1_1 [Lachancea fermentati]|uniref:LAFE_0F07734g1_1 n=1 Tax=Lachancea fermentati TaxID=4955 RepID=A0A1G4MFG3_LACFM|nr:LAFE_0F07734g1_1 [Lachancea fermentati]
MSEKKIVDGPKVCDKLRDLKIDTGVESKNGCKTECGVGCEDGCEPGCDTCHCEDSLDIFERCVQDPCSAACNDLDEEQSDCAVEEEHDCEPYMDDELDPLQENVVCDGHEYGRGPKGEKRARDGKNDCESRCSNCHRLRRWKTDGHADDPSEPVLRCSRTNSFMSQLSRQASRQSLPDAGDALDMSPGSRSRSRSSFSGTGAIPTHLYCLERFVSSELDSAAEFFFKGDSADENTRMASPVTSITSQHCPSILHATTSTSPVGSAGQTQTKEADRASPEAIPAFLTRRKSRMSSIEVSLLNSLS